MSIASSIAHASRIQHDAHETNPLSGKRVDVDVHPHRHGAQPVCSDCRRRPALTRIRGRYVVSEDHDLCRQCWRTRMDSRTATRLARRGRSR